MLTDRAAALRAAAAEEPPDFRAVSCETAVETIEKRAQQGPSRGGREPAVACRRICSSKRFHTGDDAAVRENGVHGAHQLLPRLSIPRRMESRSRNVLESKAAPAVQPPQPAHFRGAYRAASIVEQLYRPVARPRFHRSPFVPSHLFFTAAVATHRAFSHV